MFICSECNNSFFYYKLFYVIFHDHISLSLYLNVARDHVYENILHLTLSENI